MIYKFPYLADVAKLQTLTDFWQKATGVPLSIIDPKGSILTKAGRQDICRHFCQLGGEKGARCVRSDTTMGIKGMASRKYTVEKCSNGLVDASMPITVLDEHIGNFIAGPFFLQPPDLGFYKRQAAQLGFNERRYVDAVS